MPVMTGKDTKGCYARWGGGGKKYRYKCGDKAGRERAKGKAARQGRAAHAGGYKSSGSNYRRNISIKQKWETPTGQQILKDLEVKFGKYKKITLTTTGKSYKVPLRDILTVGIKGIDLPKYPKWENG